MMRATVCAMAVFGLLVPLAYAVDSAEDPFAEGSAWLGDYKAAAIDAQIQKWALTITERKGKTFKGDILVKNRDKEIETIKVEGTATEKSAGAIVCKSEKKGLAQVKLNGKLKNGEVILVSSGTDRFGKPGAGLATLKPKN